MLPKFKFHKMRLGEIFRPYFKRSLPRYCTKAYCWSSCISIDLISPSYSSPLDFQILRQNIPAFQESLAFFNEFLPFFSSVMTVEAPSMEKNVINKLKGKFVLLDLSPGGAACYFFRNCSDLL